jgi:pyrroline-5-carboxylate reductase
MNQTLLFIGGGNMALAIVQGLLKNGIAAGQIHVLELLEAAREKFAAMGVGASNTLPEGYTPDVAVLAVKPQQMKAALAPLADSLTNSLIISIAAGLPITLLSDWLKQHPRIVRSMPNTPAMVGMGVSGVFASTACNSADKAQAQTILEACGSVVWLENEAMLNPTTAISGSGPGYVFLFMEALENAALSLGFDAAQARSLVSETFRGAAELACQSDEPFSVLRERVTSKGGTTAAGLEAMLQGQVSHHIQAGANAANARSIELGELLSKG